MSTEARFGGYFIALISSFAAPPAMAQMPGLAVGNNQRAAFRTRNFVTYADSQEVARRVGTTAEQYRKSLAIAWLGRELPAWSKHCEIRVRVGTIGAGGATTFRFVNGGVRDWKMRVQGSLERVLDSVIPHEVNHTIFASHFKRPLPRWADEGAATLFEHSSERSRQLRLLSQVHRQGRRYTLRQLLTMMEYPKDMQRVLTLYAQGYSLVDFLVQQKGRRKFVEFLEEAGRSNWEAAIQKHYDHRGIDMLDGNWDGWFLAGSPQLATPGLPSPGAQATVARVKPPTQGAQNSPTFVPATGQRASTATLRPRSHAPVIAPDPIPASNRSMPRP